MRNNRIHALFLIITLIAMIGCSSPSAENTFSIKGKLDGVDKSYFLCAVELYEDSLIVDTININLKGEFNYRKNIDKLTKVSLFFSGSQISPLFVDKNLDIQIEGNIADIYSLKIKGGDSNEEIAKFRSENKNLLENNSDLLVDSVLRYIERNKDKFSSVALLDLYLKGNFSPFRLDSLIHTFSATILDMPYTKNLLLGINESRRAEVGMVAPTFKLRDTKDKLIDLSTYSDKEDILLTFVDKEDSLLLDIFTQVEKEIPDLSVLPFLIETKKSKTTVTKRDYLFDGRGWASEIVSKYDVKKVPYYVVIDSLKQIKSRGELTKDVVKAIKSVNNKD